MKQAVHVPAGFEALQAAELPAKSAASPRQRETARWLSTFESHDSTFGQRVVLIALAVELVVTVVGSLDYSRTHALSFGCRCRELQILAAFDMML